MLSTPRTDQETSLRTKDHQTRTWHFHTPHYLYQWRVLADFQTSSNRRLASMLADKRHQCYATTMGWLRYHLSFSLLWQSILCIRGSRSHTEYTPSVLKQWTSPSVKQEPAFKLLVELSHNLTYIYILLLYTYYSNT